MRKNIKLILLLSISLNLFCILILSTMIFKNVAPSTFKNKVISVFSQQKSNTNGYYFERADQFKTLDITSKDIIFVGDSITDMGEWSEIFNNPNVKNRGINGDNISRVKDRIGNIAKGNPKSIFLMIGTNDLSGNPDISSLLKDYEGIVKIIKDTSPSTKIYIQSVLPVNSTSWKNDSNVALNNRIEPNERIKLFNLKIKEIAENENAEYINLFDKFTDSDGNLDMKYSGEGLHLIGNGYMLWKQAIQQYIN